MSAPRKKSSKEEAILDVKALAPTREDILLEENKKLQLEINKLREAARPKPASKLILSDEELIAQLQLERIKFKALEQELTLEEIKKYDLLVKNKRLAEGNPTVVADYKKLPENVSEEELIQIASGQIKEEAYGQEE